MSKLKRSLVALVAVLMFVAAAGGGVIALVVNAGDEAGDDDPNPSAGPSTRAPSAPANATVKWQPCQGDQALDCATVTVPVDYDEPEGDTIEIAINRRPASGDSLGPLLINPGGPGAPGTDIVERASDYFRPQLLERYDIVGFDPRGTGDSHPIDCLSDAELSEYLAGEPDPDNRQEAVEFVADLKAFWNGCAANSDDLLGHITTAEAARDMDRIRAALGQPKLDYFGFSYGTKLGATYAELFPKRVGRMVLDGAVDVSASSREQSLTQAKGFETALRAYVQHCVDEGECVLGDSVEAGLTTIQQTLAEIEEDPLPAGDRELRIGDAFYGLITPLYVREYWSYLDQALEMALNGDGTLLLTFSDAYHTRTDGRYENNGSEAISAINCLDDPWSVPASEVPKHMPDFLEASPTFGRVFAWGLVGCQDMPVKSDEPKLDIDGAGAAPIIVTGTTRDPATPYEWAEALAEQLESGVFLSRDGDGHTAYNSDNACIDETIEAYLIEGTVPGDGKEC